MSEYEDIIKKGSDYTVVGIPNSGLISAKSFSIHLNLKYEQLIIKNNI